MQRHIAAGSAWLCLAAFPALSSAQDTPVGLWKTIDDSTHTAKALVRITESAGVLTGKIEKVLDPAAAPDAVCSQCTDERKGSPLLGLTLLRNVKHSADDVTVWDGGDVLDPKNGKTYRARLKPLGGGKALEMRGYIGPFFRNQIWQRVE